MRSEMVYVELKTGYSDNGPAWIGTGFFNRTGRTIYFNGQILKRSSAGGSGNHYDLETGDEYWISGVKKRGADRHWAGAGKIEIDAGVVDEYLRLRDLSTLPSNQYTVVHLNNVPAKDVSVALENQPFAGITPPAVVP